MSAEAAAAYAAYKAEAAAFAAWKAEQERKESLEAARRERATYGQLVDAELEGAMPVLRGLSEEIQRVKRATLDNFGSILAMKREVLKITREGQESHTFTNSRGDARVIIGHHVTDGWRDTVEEGIAIVKESVVGLIKDAETRALVNQILRLLSRDREGNLKAARVLQLRKMAEELRNDRLNEGIAIIEEAYLPATSRVYIRARYKDEDGNWRNVPLGMTEA
ncbi:MAG: DUF3164 family protein [Odoribacteraceae bacterium]|nr:DUF3164 family protein [Odoribacteraceae bacterium]